MLTRYSKEHQRRSPDCLFFALSKSSSKKTARGWKDRSSEASRTSTQSNIIAASKDISMIDVDMQQDNSLSGGELDMVDTSKPMKGAKKGSKGKKGPSKPRRKPSTVAQDEALADNNIIEPEDDDFEIKTQQELQQAWNARKRKSDEMSIDEGDTQAKLQLDHIRQVHPTKRRATRSSVSHPYRATDSSLAAHQEYDPHLSDTENMAKHSDPVSKKVAKGRSKRGSASTRKASTTSTASKACLRATLPNDEEIDVALEADLNKPLTDDEVELDPPTVPKTKSRRLTRTRPGSRNITASTAPVRRTTRTSAMTIEGESMVSVNIPAYSPNDENGEEPKAIEIALTAMDHAKQEVIADADKQKSSKTKTRARAPSKTSKVTKKEVKAVDESHTSVTIHGIQQESLNTKPSTRYQSSPQESKQCPEKTFRTSEVPAESILDDEVAELNSSGLAPADASEDSIEEVHAPQPEESRARKAGRPRNTGAKKGKAVKKGVAASRKLDEKLQVETKHTEREDPIVLAVSIKIPDNQESTGEPTAPEVRKDENDIPSKGSEQTAIPQKPSKISPSQATSVEEPLPIERSPVTAHETQAMAGIATPATSQIQDEGQKIPSQSPSPHVQRPSVKTTPKMVTSPQSSDVENQPPSSRPSALRPPLLAQTPSKTRAIRIPLATTTPMASPSKQNISRLQTTLPWESIDFERIFNSPSAEEENVIGLGFGGKNQGLSSPEKDLTVEEWIRWKAKRGEEKLREDCEKLVGKFEGEGVRALKTLEGIVCIEQAGECLALTIV